MLLSAGIEPPRKIAVHGFVYIGGQKASKTEKGGQTDPNAALLKDPVKLVERFGPDAVRYFLLREIAFGQDGEISWTKLLGRYNSELANDLGNLLNRVVSMTERYLGGTFETKGAPLPQDGALREKMTGLPDRIAPLMERMEFHTALGEIFDGVRAANGYIAAAAPWTLNKHGKKEEVAGVLSDHGVLTVAIAGAWEYIREGTRVRKGPVLFQKIDGE